MKTVMPRIETALIRKDMRRVRTGDGFRVDAMFGGGERQIYRRKGKDITIGARKAAEGVAGEEKKVVILCYNSNARG